MEMEGVDYSSARPGGAALVAAGKGLAVRYLYPGIGKGIQAPEVADLHAHGILIAVAYEGGGGDALEGYVRGVRDATLAQAQLVLSGLNPDLPVFFAVDFPASGAQLQVIDTYLVGAASVISASRVGVYGSFNVIQHCQASRSAEWFWQTYAWSNRQVADGIHLYQYNNGQTINGGAVDFTRSMQANFGQLAAGTTALDSTPITSVTPPTQEEIDEMTATKDAAILRNYEVEGNGQIATALIFPGGTIVLLNKTQDVDSACVAHVQAYGIPATNPTLTNVREKYGSQVNDAQWKAFLAVYPGTKIGF
jgi:hypothetical protein